MIPSSTPLRFYFDVISPNAYLAWAELPKVAGGRPIEPVPVLFAGLLEAHDQLGPAEVLPKARWMARNNLRKAARLGLPLNPPAHHPFNPLLALRVAALPRDPAERSTIVGALLDAVWVRQEHVSEAEVLHRVLDRAGLDAAALLAAAVDPENKQRLRRNTEEAVAAGVFGVPTIEVAGELFWGYDDLPQLEDFLAGDAPELVERMERWMTDPRPSAKRTRR